MLQTISNIERIHIENKRTNIKRLTINIPTGIHDEIKRLSERRHITITRWMLRGIIERIIKERS